MLEYIIRFSLRNKLIILLFTITTVIFGLFSITQIPIGALPDVTNNQVQVITTSRNLSTQDVEQFITYPIELEMANLPGVKEIRSVSKFGLSVVTIVFDEKMGMFLPRQLIAEKIRAAQEKIPEGFGTPTMGPITTGLGEIYQYILDTKPGYDSVYSVMDLRTIQDWIVKRQLSGIPGVVEVNTWGGFLKQYEVALDPEKMRALNVTAIDVYNALEANNNIAGGAYIEKDNQSYFIRGDGLVRSLEDIRKVVIRNVDGVPVLVKDVAEVRYGHAIRFGAITGNGEGEKVLGQVMMLKDANSKKVIEAVHKRVEEIQKTLPEGVYINAFLDRSELIHKTSLTVIENLVFGFLIVMFVVLLLLGDLRSGLLISSIIPLALLFTISMMYIFHVDANLMSLGAIDFGIIIDGAVIIVEFIAFSISMNYGRITAVDDRQRQEMVDGITFDSTKRMMSSAIFGQVIILIVFIPILSLSGVEGKMFRPMALTFSFAIIGAMIMGLTYVPVMASLFLKPQQEKRNISTRLMNGLKRMYLPTIRYALGHKTLVIVVASLMLLISLGIFSRMGGEFVPTLDEGDFVIQPVFKTGTSLTKTIELVTRIEKILKKFPEVDQVVSRIGAAEVPTDPMSMEEVDVIIKLKPKKYWVTARTKDGLADKFKEALMVIPGVDYEFTQPIEMRFNELITGVRADVAVKIYGEDLGILSRKAKEISRLVRNVEGASDVTVEKVEGLPQMSVRYDRRKLAEYGVSVKELNDMVSLAFAGLVTGNVFEGEKRFDLVVRLQDRFRKDIHNLERLYVPVANGKMVPLTELADIRYTKGPAKISRDATKRRIVVGINVRNRDLESVVKDVQRLIEEKVTLPPGYYIDYGGQFDNLRSAKKRLAIAVPVSLLLIFILLHFAFRSILEAAMIYTAIPLASIGGILLLWMRGMPFSVSAGIGFIALFGIAVLNGIVLIEYFKELKEKGMKDINELIIKGTTDRLRPVMLTASAAALGFLPMAVSTSAGAEVQRPLATVVIGGLVTSTFLTMVVLPVFYAIYDRMMENRKRRRRARGLLVVLLLFLLPWPGQAQTLPVDRTTAIETALRHNRALQADSLRAAGTQMLVNSAVDIGKTSIYYNYDENNVADNGYPIKVWGIQQELAFPTVYSSRKKVNRYQAQMAGAEYELKKRRLMREVSEAYLTVVYLQNKYEVYRFLDSLNDLMVQATEKNYELGGNNYLDKLNAVSMAQKMKTSILQLQEEVAAAYKELRALMGVDTAITVVERRLVRYGLPQDTTLHPGILYHDYLLQAAQAQGRLEKNKLLPDLQLEYFQGTNRYAGARTYPGFTVGVAVPVWFGAQRSRIRSARLASDAAGNRAAWYRRQLESKKNKLMDELRKYEEALQYYDRHGKELSRQLVRSATLSYQKGEIDLFRYIMTVRNATTIELDHLDNLYRYDRTVLELQYLDL